MGRCLLERRRPRPRKAKKDKKGNDDQEDKKDPLQAKLNSLVEETRAKGERRNSYLNLAYTAPQENTALHRNIPYSKVASVVVDMFMDTSLPPGEPPTSTAQAASVDGDVVKAERPSLLASIEALPKFPWKIPKVVERGYEIPICVTET